MPSRTDLKTDHKPQHFLAVAALALAGSFWGTGFLFGKIAFQEMTVTEDVAFRFVTAAVALFPVMLRRWRPYRGKDFWLLLLAAAIGIPLQYMIQFEGLHLTTVSHAALIIGVIPVLLAVTSALFLHERLHRLEWAALGASALGAVFIAISGKAGGGPAPDWRGDLLVLVSLFAAVVMVVCSKRLIATHDALHVTAVSIGLGTLILLGWAEMSNPLRFHFSAAIWGAAVAQGLLATAAAYLLWNWGLSYLPALRAGVFLNLEPVVGAVLGVTLLHERLGRTAILGGLLIVGAAVYFSLRPQEA